MLARGAPVNISNPTPIKVTPSSSSSEVWDLDLDKLKEVDDFLEEANRKELITA